MHQQADLIVIEAAYRRLARKFHPDVNQESDAHQRMMDINEAYEVLGDPARRAAYDIHCAGPNPIDKHIGRYEIIREIARSNDIVYEAWDPQTGRRVAVKVLHIPPGMSDDDKKDKLARFDREARAAGRLHHPNIVTVFDAGCEHLTPYLVMELIEGPTLGKHITTKVGPDPKDATTIVLQILQALQHAHEHGVVHRDIKPDNIFLLPDGTVKLGDFGIARIEGDAKVTGTGAILGTVSYMAPEQVLAKNTDHRADLWAVGVVLFQMLVRELPFRGASAMAVGSAIVNDTPSFDRLPKLSVSAIVVRALNKDPGGRYQSAKEMHAALKSASSGHISTPLITPQRAPASAAGSPPQTAIPQPTPNIHRAKTSSFGRLARITVFLAIVFWLGQSLIGWGRAWQATSNLPIATPMDAGQTKTESSPPVNRSSSMNTKVESVSKTLNDNKSGLAKLQDSDDTGSSEATIVTPKRSRPRVRPASRRQKSPSPLAAKPKNAVASVPAGGSSKTTSVEPIDKPPPKVGKSNPKGIAPTEGG